MATRSIPTHGDYFTPLQRRYSNYLFRNPRTILTGGVSSKMCDDCEGDATLAQRSKGEWPPVPREHPFPEERDRARRAHCAELDDAWRSATAARIEQEQYLENEVNALRQEQRARDVLVDERRRIHAELEGMDLPSLGTPPPSVKDKRRAQRDIIMWLIDQIANALGQRQGNAKKLEDLQWRLRRLADELARLEASIASREKFIQDTVKANLTSRLMREHEARQAFNSACS